jgi:superfamily I DNA and/or RNA helicase
MYGEILRKFRSWAGTQRRIPADQSLEDVYVELIDIIQGTDCSVVIMDTTVADRIGFMRESKRIIVGVLRARDGILIIGSSAAFHRRG